MSVGTESTARGVASLTRRQFLKSGFAVGAATLAAPYIARGQSANNAIRVAVIGIGAQGRILINACLQIPNLEFRGVCDIWQYNRTSGERLLRRYGHDVRAYEDYREMLASERDLDAVIVATPDWVHAEHTNAALEAGCHVYCEKLMSNTVEGARSMVETANRTGKLLQIGHQRRSNPRYIHARENLVHEAGVLGRITNINGQWNRAVTDPIGWPQRFTMSQEQLDRYGYRNMNELRNWRWFKKYGGGPISDLGAHQIDIYNWMLKTNPTSVLAGGGRDFYKDFEWPDNVMAIYEYPTAEGMVRAFYQVLTTTSAGAGYYEYFMGTEGALRISENHALTRLYQEAHAPQWTAWVRRGWIRRAGEDMAVAPTRPWEKPRAVATTVDVRETADLAAWEIPVELDKAIHQPHLENFFDTIRGQARLTCPAEEGYASTVTVLKVNEAIESERKEHFAPEAFKV